MSFLIVNFSFSQENNRLSNPDYMWTSLYEEFDSSILNRETWRVSASESRENGLFIWADSSVTVNQKDGNLELSMVRHSGFKAVNWAGETISSNFIAGQIATKAYFSYGIFECNATFAHKNGSFPAFWLYNDYMCDETARTEIDIVELKRNFISSTLDNTVWYYPLECLPAEAKNVKTTGFINWNKPHTFKCIWNPEKIEYWMDERKLHEVINDGQNWYPKLPRHVILSQQLVRFGWLDPRMDRIETPQTSYFHWVKVREYFLAPEISLSGSWIYSEGSATLDVDSLADSITWKLSPENLFETTVSGKGATVKFKIVPSAIGQGKVTFSFKMPDGETFEVERIFDVGKPGPSGL